MKIELTRNLDDSTKTTIDRLLQSTEHTKQLLCTIHCRSVNIFLYDYAIASYIIEFLGRCDVVDSLRHATEAVTERNVRNDTGQIIDRRQTILICESQWNRKDGYLALILCAKISLMSFSEFRTIFKV